MPNIFDAEKPRDLTTPVPAGVVAPMILRVKRGPDGDILTPSQNSDARYLNCAITIIDGPYAGSKAFPRLVVEGSSDGAQTAKDISHGLIASIVRSALGVRIDDMSPAVEAKLKDFNFEDLDNVNFIGKIERGKLRDPSAGPNSDRYDDKTTIATGVTPDMTTDWEAWKNAPRGLSLNDSLHGAMTPGSPRPNGQNGADAVAPPPWAD
jgi:hypothetical protein